jgi:hypothetical protein
MSLIHPNSGECVKPELDFQIIPPTLTSVLSGHIKEIRPNDNLQSNSGFSIPNSLTFNFNGGNQYIDSKQTFLALTGKIVNADGSPIENAICAPVNSFMNSIFSDVILSVNGHKIDVPDSNYAYKCYLQNLLNHGQDSKSTHMGSSIWEKDEAWHFDSINLEGSSCNQGFIDRYLLVKDSKLFDLYGRLHVDLFNQNRYLYKNMKFDLTLLRNRDSFYLMGDTKSNYQYIITSALLHVRYVDIHSNILGIHQKLIANRPLAYPYKRTTTKNFVVPSGLYQYDLEISKKVPNILVIGFVSNIAYKGSYDTNPFNFNHFNLSSLDLTIGGYSVLPQTASKLDFKNNLYSRAYYSLYNSVFKGAIDHGNDISRKEFCNGYTLFVYDLTPDMTSGDNFNLIQNDKQIVVKLQFETPLESPIYAICYFEYDALLTFNNFDEVEIY